MLKPDKLLKRVKQLSNMQLAEIVAVFVVVGLVGYALVVSHAAGAFLALEAEQGTSSGVTVVNDSSASGGKAVQFGAAPSPTPTPAQTPPPKTPPPPAAGVNYLDYQTGNFLQWRPDQQYNRPAQLSVQTASAFGIPSRPGMPYAARFITQAGDFTSNGSERGEVYTDEAHSGNITEGKTWWYAWSTFYPVGYNLPTPRGNWEILTQWHGTSGTVGGGPNLTTAAMYGLSSPYFLFGILGDGGQGTYAWQYGQGNQYGPNTAGDRNVEANWQIKTGVWTDFRVGVTWSSGSGARTIIKVGQPGALKTIVDSTTSNKFGGQSVYWKQGIYRMAQSKTTTIYYAGTRNGPTEASVTY